MILSDAGDFSSEGKPQWNIMLEMCANGLHIRFGKLEIGKNTFCPTKLIMMTSCVLHRGDLIFEAKLENKA